MTFSEVFGGALGAWSDYNKTQQEVANELGINQVKVSREEGKVLTKLKKYM